jgi:putative hemolysin
MFGAGAASWLDKADGEGEPIDTPFMDEKRRHPSFTSLGSWHDVMKTIMQPSLVSTVLTGPILARHRDYVVRLALAEEERRAAYRLRFEVFNLELNEGLDSAYETGEDVDPFDAVCEHLIVEHEPTNRVVGTYRMQSGRTASLCKGYYSEQEFDFSPYESIRGEVIELGRACVHQDFRTYDVINLLWHGISRYTHDIGARYLIGCSSVTSQDAFTGWATYARLKKHLAPTELQTIPTESYRLPMLAEPLPEELPDAPKLLRMYLMVGAYICGEPAIDRAFKTIDFLTLLDLEQLTPSFRVRYLGKR